MKIVGGRIHKMRIEEVRVGIVSRGCGVFVESGDDVRNILPFARVRACIAVIKVVVDDGGRVALLYLRFD